VKDALDSTVHMAAGAGECVRYACRTNGWCHGNRFRTQLHWNARHIVAV